MSTPWTTENLNDYLDDRLSADERTRLEKLVRHDRAAIEKLRELRRLRGALQKAPRFQLTSRFTQRVIDRLPDMYRDHDPANLAGLDDDTAASATPSSARSTWQVAIGLIATLAASLLLVILTSPPLREPAGVASNAGNASDTSDERDPADESARTESAPETDRDGIPVVPSGETAQPKLDTSGEGGVASPDRSPAPLPGIAQLTTNSDANPASEAPGIAPSQMDSGIASTDPRAELPGSPSDGGEALADDSALAANSTPPLALANNTDIVPASSDLYDRLVVVRLSTDAYQTAFTTPPVTSSNSSQIADSQSVEVSRFHLNQQPGALTAPTQATDGETAEAAPSSSGSTSEVDTNNSHAPTGDDGLSPGQTRFVLVEATPEELATLLDDLHATTGALKQADAAIALRSAADSGARFNATPLQFQPDVSGDTPRASTDGADGAVGVDLTDGADVANGADSADGEKEADKELQRLRYLIVVVLSDV